MTVPQQRVEFITASALPPPAGHYSHATQANGFVFVSGQLPVSAQGAPEPDAGFEAQAELALRNMLAILVAAGSDADHLVRVTAYIVGVENWPMFNSVYANLLPNVRPARTVVPVAELHHGCLVEIDAIALVKSER